MEMNDNLTDSELPQGLPSDVESEEPVENPNKTLGFVVPAFINKLREEARPLLSLSKGVPSPTKQLKENGCDKLKESRAKKRLFRGRQEPPNGVIERRYGYIPNPRWGKSVSNSHGRQFVPQGIGEDDRNGVPGVIFRDGQSDSAPTEQSSKEVEFPQLGASITDSRFSPVPEPTRAGNPAKQGKMSQSCRDSLLDKSDPSNHVLGRRSVSPLTSTPVRWGENAPSPGLGNSTLESTYFSAVEFIGDSPKSINNSVRSAGSSSCFEKSMSANMTQSFSSNSGRRVIRKLAPSPLATTSVPSPVMSSNRVVKNLNHLSDFNPTKVNGSWSDIARGSPSQTSGLLDTHMLSSPASKSFSPQTESNKPGENMWPQMLKKQSPCVSVPQKNTQEPDSSDPQSWPLTNAAASSPLCGSVSNKQGKENARPPIHNGRGALLHAMNKSQSPGRQPEESFPRPINGSYSSALQDRTTHPQSDKFKEEEPSSNSLSRRQRKNKQRKAKSSCNAPPSSSDIHVSQSPSSSPVCWEQNRKQNFKPKSSNRGPSTHFTLENFITPQKHNGKKNGMKSEKKDISMLESRFVEHIAANPTSPPKKLRPSPIKKMSLSKRENNSDWKEAEASELNAGGDAGFLLNGKGESLREYVKPKDSVQKALNAEEMKNEPPKSPLVFSMNKFFKDKPAEAGDVFEEENEDEDEYPGRAEKEEVQQFWGDAFALPTDLMTPRKVVMPAGHIEDENENLGVGCQFLSPLLKPQDVADLSWEEDKSSSEGDVVHADPSKVHHKKLLIRKAQRYCHYFEEHQVPNVAVELYFVIQLLTCTEVDKDILHFVDVQFGRTVFRSIHNGVYFAVKVIKRLRRLFANLGKAYVELLAESQRIKDFSPYLHKYFKQELLKRVEDPLTPILVEHSPFNTDDDGMCSFPDANYAHVFKCQRDNFYAFYRHYHDTNSVYEFKIESQIQYVYDGCTPEQNSMVNLMHLAKLFIDHLLLCCVTQRPETVDLLEMIKSKGVDEKQFTKLYEAFFASTSASSGTASPPPGFSDHQMFFRDFLETLSSPAFNEHLKNLLVMKILELNSQTFSTLCNLHSAAALEENKTPLRSRPFTDTVLSLCIMGKVLGFLTFAPYTSGFQSLSQNQASSLLSMREMTPLPLPLPLLLKQAFDKGHLCITVPWVVEFLSQMDCMAPQLSSFKSLLQKLHFIQRYAWDSLYKEGHTNSGLLIASCISWLFESPPVPSGFFYTCKSSFESMGEDDTGNSRAFQIDRQKLVSQNLLTSCCPYLEQGQVLLTLFALKQKIPVCDMAVIPYAGCTDESSHNGTDQNTKSHKDIEEIERWLGSSLHLQDSASTSSVHEKRAKNVIDDEVVPAYVLTRLLSTKETDDLEDIESNLLLSDTFMKSMVESAVDLVCAKLAHYTQKTILRLLVFTCKAEVRQHFQNMPDAETAEFIKNKLLADVNLAAARLSDTAKASFYQVAERVSQTELPSLLNFLSSTQDEVEKQDFVCVARRMCLLRLSEWSSVQLGPELFVRTITREAKRCARVPGKPVALYPNDYSKKSEEYTSPEITPGFVELEQLSELIDTALSHGVWYINALTPGQRPNSDHIIKLIKDFTSCIEKRMITMDFAFYVMSNFLMHLIIQYMVDAPANWTEDAERAFVQLCVLCKERKLENDSVAVHLPSGPGGRRPKSGLRMKVKVMNLMSVHTLSWLAKTQVQDETMMVYCRLLCGLVVNGVLHVETVCSRLLHSRDNKNLSLLAKTMANRAMVKVLSLLYWSIRAKVENTSNTSVGSDSKQENTSCFYQRLQAGQSKGQREKLLAQEGYSHERVIALVMKLWSQSSSSHDDLSHFEKDVQADLVARLEVAFGNLLVQDGSVCSSESH
ncbi:codanin-1 [Elysia marginata]|uniref:Codanin-1 n=1 Tax=Elysia marginata TaxID=1093978 RepID=A0AAV4IQ13_9GAST|nr:codanin-1 [Elysia marginata]